jgi:hypothetical protein
MPKVQISSNTQGGTHARWQDRRLRSRGSNPNSSRWSGQRARHLVVSQRSIHHPRPSHTLLGRGGRGRPDISRGVAPRNEHLAAEDPSPDQVAVIVILQWEHRRSSRESQSPTAKREWTHHEMGNKRKTTEAQKKRRPANRSTTKASS